MMMRRTLSWEIILAGFAFIGIAIFLLNNHSSSPSQPSHPQPDSMRAPHAPLPPSFVIDLQNLESLKNLRNLKELENLENLQHLEIELQNLDKILKDQERVIEKSTENSLNSSLEKLEKHFQQIEEGSFDVRLQDHKIFINREFKVKEASWSEVSPGVYLYRTSLKLDPGSNVDLNLGFGNINIVGNDSTSGELTLQATGDVDDPQMLAQNLRIQSDRNRTFNIQQTGDMALSDRVNIEATLTVPRETNFEVSTSGGHISATHLQGNHRMITSGGHITIDDLRGTTYAKTSGGHITSDRIQGEATLNTTGGHIRIEHADGDFKLHTGGGNIKIDGLRGRANAKTSGGNISATVLTLDGPLDLGTSAGNISVLLPPGINADISTRGSATTIEKAFDFSGSRSNGNINGAINNGGVPIRLHCGYGNVSIKTHDEL